jgi:hypothetical protein
MNTNRISTRTFLNPFSGKTFYVLEVDGRSVEDIILGNQPEITRGIVPTLLNWLRDDEEKQAIKSI